MLAQVAVCSAQAVGMAIGLGGNGGALAGKAQRTASGGDGAGIHSNDSSGLRLWCAHG